MNLCCCAEDEDWTETRICASGATDEQVRAYEIQPPTSLLGLEPDAFPGPPQPPDKEKERLQSLVAQFAADAVRGLPCFYIKEATGEILKTRYRITKNLGSLIVDSPDARETEVSCPLALIHDIYTGGEDGVGVFQTETLNLVYSSELRSEDLLLIVCRGSEKEGEPHRVYSFCLAIDDHEHRDTFLECLRILCVYALNHSH
mmetsp:Transcript_124130/g.241873  ORF Transcript_124130/g.241873 Transcript_124130/m.241873 type:complete len:202 (+) Transcript_124130:116-721(+)